MTAALKAIAEKKGGLTVVDARVLNDLEKVKPPTPVVVPKVDATKAVVDATKTGVKKE